MHRKSQSDGVPWIMLIVLIVGVMFVSALFSRAVTRSYTPFTTYVPRNPTSEGIMLASDLQATTNAEQATAIARSTRVFEPTSTPRSSSQNESLGDQFLRLGQPERAVNAYTDAINADTDNANLYIRRAEAYSQMYAGGDETAINLALEDYNNALSLDGTLAEAYLGRGLVYYDLSSTSPGYAENALDDLEYYFDLTPGAENAEVQLILDELR